MCCLCVEVGMQKIRRNVSLHCLRIVKRNVYPPKNFPTNIVYVGYFLSVPFCLYA